jgi:hypothetical protein
LFGIVLGLSACSGSALTDSCGVAGRQRSCPCSGRAIGIQICQLDGTWETCTCYGINAGTGGASGNGGASGAAGTSTRSSAIEADRGGRGGASGSTSRSTFPFGGRPARRD